MRPTCTVRAVGPYLCMAKRRSARTAPSAKPGRGAPRPAQRRTRSATTSPSWRTELTLRELFWTNMVREMLTNLSMLALQVRGQGPRRKAGAPLHEMLDGRIAVVTRRGRRLGIADVMPLFACGVPTSDETRAISMAVECSVFRIVTPEGEVWTLPLSEIRSVHALSEELITQLQKELSSTEASPRPFGFAAFTSLAQGGSRRSRRRRARPDDDAPLPPAAI